MKTFLKTGVYIYIYIYIYIYNDFNRGSRLLCRRMKVTENTELTTFLILLLNLRCPVVNSLSLFVTSQTYNNNSNNNNNNNNNNSNNNE